MILIVSYDLSNAPNRTQFFDALKQQGVWWRYLTSTWLISTQKTPTEVYDALAPTMFREDRLLIFELARAHQGWLPKDAWDWIEQQQAIDALRTLGQSSGLPSLLPLGALSSPTKPSRRSGIPFLEPPRPKKG